MAPLGPTLVAFALVGVLVAAPGPRLAVSDLSKPPALEAGAPWRVTIRAEASPS